MIDATLAQDVVADRDYPPFDRVCMDGIAIKFSDDKTLSKTTSKTLNSPTKKAWEIIDVIKAGTAVKKLPSSPSPNRAYEKKVYKDRAYGVAYEIGTGAVLPQGADTIIPYEHLEILQEKEGDKPLARLKPGIPCKLGQNIHYQGSDSKIGSILLEKGSIITSPHISVLTSLGIKQLEVFSPPKIYVLSTGNEIVDFTLPVKPQQIRSSNLWQIKAELVKSGFHQVFTDKVRDERLALKTKIKNAFQKYDLVIIIGGISKGKYDLVKEVLFELGVNEIFHGVTQKPGKPMFLGRVDRAEQTIPIFSLPGNPQSSLVSLVRYVIPFLRKKINSTVSPTPPKPFDLGVRQIRLKRPVNFKKPLTLFQLVKLNKNYEGEPIKNQGSGDFIALRESDGFVEIPKRRKSEMGEKQRETHLHKQANELYNFYPW